MKTHLQHFFRTPLGVGAVAASALLSAGAYLSGWLPLPAALPAFVVLTAASGLILMQTRLGGTAIVSERDRERAEEDLRALAKVQTERKRLSLLRIADPAVAAAVGRAALAAGHYLEAAARGADRDPLIEDAVSGARATVDDYLRLIDAASGDQTDYAARSLGLLNGAAAEIERRLSLNGVSAEDRLRAREELE